MCLLSTAGARSGMPGLLRPAIRGLAEAIPVVGTGAELVRRAPGTPGCSIQLSHIARCAALSNAEAKELRKPAVRFGPPAPHPTHRNRRGKSAKPAAGLPQMCAIRLSEVRNFRLSLTAGQCRLSQMGRDSPVAGYGKATARELVCVDRPSPGGPSALHATRPKRIETTVARVGCGVPEGRGPTQLSTPVSLFDRIQRAGGAAPSKRPAARFVSLMPNWLYADMIQILANIIR